LSRAWSLPFVGSVLVHGALFGGIAGFLANDPPHVRGGAGLAGASQTHFDVTVSVEVPAKSEAKPLPPVREGVEVPREKKLPDAVKNPHPREIEEPPNSDRAPEKSTGTSAEAPAGTEGQNGTGTTANDSVGDGDRSNRYGIYLEKMRRQIQRHVENPGLLSRDYRTVLVLRVRKDGSVERIEIAQSSGDSTLDRKAVRAVEKAQPFDPWEKDQAIQLPVIFRRTD
jgi:protein TonB